MTNYRMTSTASLIATAKTYAAAFDTRGMTETAYIINELCRRLAFATIDDPKLRDALAGGAR